MPFCLNTLICIYKSKRRANDLYHRILLLFNDILLARTGVLDFWQGLLCRWRNSAWWAW